MPTQIRYMAVVSENPVRLAEFYSTYFGLKEIGRGAKGEIALTDGFYNMSIMKPGSGAEEPGLSHFGIEIDDIREVEARLEDFAPSADIQQESGDLFHGEYRVIDPYGWPVSLSTRHFGAPTVERGLPSLRHVAHRSPVSKHNEVCDFLTKVFGFRESESNARLREKGSQALWVGDGATAVAILPTWVGRDDFDAETESLKEGLNHYGWLVNDIFNFMDRLPEGSVTKRPDNRPAAEYRGHDPDGNPFDLSQDKGYEIDRGTWLHV